MTYSLVNDGLMVKQTTELRLDAWLKEGAARLPSLRPAPPAAHSILAAIDDDDTDTGLQQPALFDFTGKPSSVVLRMGAPAR